MFTPNQRLSQIEERNIAAAEAARAFQEDLRAGRASMSDLPRLMQQYPAFGIMPCKAAGIEFAMFHAHDDIVARNYLWVGADGYEPDLVRTWVEWCRKPGDVMDIGGYSGLMSILAARSHTENKVHLFEPLERVIERANINIKINGLSRRITLHPVAASDQTGEAQIHLYRDEDFLATGNSINRKDDKEFFTTKRITTVAIDEYLPNISPRAVKIDVEGHELAVLTGLERTLRRSRPQILIEVWENTREDVLRKLRDLGYTLERAERVDRPVNNFIARPAD